MSIVPIINIGPTVAASPRTRRAIAREIAAACENVGFFMVTGHGIPRSLVDEVDGLSRTFFDLPLEEKLRIEVPPGRHRGYRGVGAANTAKATKTGEGRSATVAEPPLPDLRETLFAGAEPVPHDPYYSRPGANRFFQQNLWPERPAGMERAFKAYYDACTRLSACLMQLFALALELPETFFDDKIDRHVTALNSVHYPKQTSPARPGQFRSGAHTDFGSLTVLATDGTPGGLQVQLDGTWHDVTPNPEAFIINLGDLMARWTNDRWRSTFHRVINPPPELAASSRRLSLVYFHQPNFDARIECLPSCIAPGEQPKYAPTTSGEHLVAQLARIYAPQPPQPVVA
jgi:isopenicillin N synthase-like dioxygenase